MIAHAPTTPGTPRAPGNRQARLLWTRLAWGVALLFSFLAPAAMASTGPIPEEEDGPLQVWNEKAKYYLIVAVDQRDVPGAKLPFTLTDAALVAKQFDTLGYRPLVQKPIVGPIATRDNLTTTLEQIRELGEWASVVIYYSGHGVASPNDKDVSLQLAGQSSLDYSKGIKVSDLIEAARGDKKYFGELHLIIDACFSGTGAFSGALTLKELGSKTTILTSSSTTQNSIAITLENGTKLSAFTQTLLQALGEEWRTADDNGDGVLRFGEVHTYTSNQLKQWSLAGRLTVNGARVHMHPQLVGGRHEEVILAYDRTKVRRWESSARQALQLAALERNLVPTTSIVTTDGQQEPEIPQEAQRLATRLIPNKDDPYAQGIKAQAEGRLKEAGTLFAQATNLEADHEEKLAKIYLARGRNETFRGNYKEALPWYQKHVALRPTKDPTRLNELGQAWARAGRYEQALPYFTEALAIRENTLEPNDPDLAVSLNNLAALYDSQGQYAEAEPLYQRALAINEQALGTEHPQVATSLNNLAELYRAQGQYAEAEPLYQRALRISEAALGSEHPSVAIRLNNLAELYRAQGQYAEAEPLYQRALAINEQALGTEHPQVATSLNNLAELYRAQGQYAEAEPLYQRALRISEAALGSEHPSVAIRLNNLAALYDSQGQYAEAEPLYQRAYTIFKARLGLAHPNTKTVLNNYAECLLKAGMQDKLIPLVPDLRAAFPGIFAKEAEPHAE